MMRGRVDLQLKIISEPRTGSMHTLLRTVNEGESADGSAQGDAKKEMGEAGITWR